MTEDYCIAFQDIQTAEKRIHGTAHETPVLTSASIDSLAGCRVFFKVEALQKTGSFKFRGALNAVRSVLEQRGESGNESLRVVTHSSGNHAQALALAARLSSTDSSSTAATTHVKATIVMPENTPDVKRKAVIAFGGTPVMTASTNEAREEKAAEIVNETGATFIHPSEDPRVIAGQGTVCLEWHAQQQQESPLDVVIIPVGGGGLAAGNTIALRALYGANVQIVLAEPQALDDAYRSFYNNKTLQGHDACNLPVQSVADGLKTTLGPHTWPIVRDQVDAIFTVSERDILVATKLVWERLKVCIEPSAGVGVAVLLYSKEFRERYGATAKNVGVVLCGGNVDVIKVAGLMKDMGV